MERIRVEPTIVKIYVTPSQVTRKGVKYEVEIPGYDIPIPPTLTPFFSAARAVQAAGVVPSNARLWMMRKGDPEPALTGPIKVAAKYTVTEPNRGKTKMVKWSPHFRTLDNDDDTGDE
jgi:hypothetical protein